MNTDKHRFINKSSQSQLKTLPGLEQYNDLTQKIIGCAYKVSNTLGAGSFEKVYENALAHELRKNSIQVQQQVALHVFYDNIVVGEYLADMVVEACILVELKAVKTLDSIHEAQCMNYLRVTGLRLCLLLNFGSTRIRIHRIAN